MKHYLIILHEYNGDYEYKHRIVMELPADKSAEEEAELYAKRFYGELDRAEGNQYYFYGGEVCVEVERVSEVSPEDYEVLKKYIFVA